MGYRFIIFFENWTRGISHLKFGISHQRTTLSPVIFRLQYLKWNCYASCKNIKCQKGTRTTKKNTKYSVWDVNENSSFELQWSQLVGILKNIAVYLKITDNLKMLCVHQQNFASTWVRSFWKIYVTRRSYCIVGAVCDDRNCPNFICQNQGPNNTCTVNLCDANQSAVM